MPRRTRPPEDRFWEKVNKTDTCWLWTASVNNMGYGEIKMADGVYYAHRFSWILANGALGKGVCVLHRCDTPRCVRPDHLFLGTQTDNMQDAIKKGRMPHLVNGPGLRGEAHGMSKLKEADVRAIRSSIKPRQELAVQFGVKPEHIWQIRTRKSWRHVS